MIEINTYDFFQKRYNEKTKNQKSLPQSNKWIAEGI